MSHLSIIMALLMGVTGSLHCAGMCGPIVWVMPFQMLSRQRKWIGILLYHLGRISVYALLGLVLFSFKSVFNPHWQQYISLALGSLLLLAGVMEFLSHGSLRVNLPFAGLVKEGLTCIISNPSLGSLFLSGGLNGLLPCGLVYMALSMAVTAPTAGQSMMLMYMFGLGTMPMLVGLTILKAKLGFMRNAQIRRFVPVLVFCFGCILIARGMNLGIPYLSPKVEVENHEVKVNCCHKTYRNR